MDAIEFLVKGSGKNPYKVTFQKNDGHVYAGCDCPARKSGLVCKHILNIVDGDITDSVSGGPVELDAINNLLQGTRFLEIYTEYKRGLKLYNTKVLTELKKAMVTKP